MIVNNNAPIVPGKGAASIMLGETIENILQGTAEMFLAEQHDTLHANNARFVRYRSSYVDIWTKDEVIWQIMVHGSYAGKVLGKIGLGSTLADVERQLGPVVVIADSIVVRGMPGISYEPRRETRDSPIIEIYVWEPDLVEVQDHQKK